MKIFSSLVTFIFVLQFSNGISTVIAQENLIPNGTLRVAYQQREEGKLSEAVHQIELWCWNNECSLTTLSLNQVVETHLGNGFFPKVERSSTSDGSLIVKRLGKGFIELEEKNEAVFTYRFSFTVRENAETSKLLGAKHGYYFDKLTDFSGGAVKSSTILNKIISWDLVPLKGNLVSVKPLGNFFLSGVPEDPEAREQRLLEEVLSKLSPEDQKIFKKLKDAKAFEKLFSRENIETRLKKVIPDYEEKNKGAKPMSAEDKAMIQSVMAEAKSDFAKSYMQLLKSAGMSEEGQKVMAEDMKKDMK